MTDRTWDPNDEVQRALGRMVAAQGKGILSQGNDGGVTFAGIMSDQFGEVPEKTKELLKQAVESGVATELERRVGAGLDPDSAVQSVATHLVSTTPNDATGCLWVTTEFARALGLNVHGTQTGLGSERDRTSSGGAPTYGGFNGGQGSGATAMKPPPSAGDLGATIGGGATIGAGVATHVGQTPGRGTGNDRRPRSPNTNILIAVVVVVVIVGAIVGLTHKSTPSSTPAPTTTPTTAPAPASTTTPTTAPTTSDVVALNDLLPSDVDPASCAPVTSNLTGFEGITGALVCSPSNLSGGQLFANQFDTEDDYATSLVALNTDVGFNPTGSSCEGSDASASVPWSDGNYPQADGQLVECYVNTKNQPVYVWTLPSQNTILDAIGEPGTSIGDLYSWWQQYNDPSN